ncbi:pyrroline-5-carboxylate reductase [Aureococcus anophagefferens]|nr:pyrroline-5-carboxylate reductase [Aureococcus anophagefferens]
MAEAMLAPLAKTEILGALPEITFYDVSCAVAQRVATKYPAAARAETLEACVDGADAAACARPQNCDAVFDRLRPLVADADPVLLSILAGVPMHRYYDGLGLDDEVVLCREALKAMGTEIFVEDESFIDMSTSISGSGPAYVFMLIEAMVDAGVQEGFSRDIATELVHQTILGSVQYSIASGEHPAVLKNSVTSPAGTTASAIYTLERGNFRTVVQDAIWACYRRSLEMGGQSTNVGPGRSKSHPPPGEFPDAVEA